jgi:aminoglycoside 3-N-acetyltransferase
VIEPFIAPRATRDTLTRQCAALGLGPGDVVMVHASLRGVGPVLGGPPELIEAIVDAVGEAGTVLVYVGGASPYDDLGRGLYSREDEAFIREHCPPFDPDRSPASRDFGAFAEFFRTRVGVRCSDQVGARMAAVGARAEALLRDHPRDFGLGEGSPLARLCDLDGKLLLLGSDADNVTLLHYAEAIAPIADKRVVHVEVPRLRDGARVWLPVVEYDSMVGIRAWPERFFAAIVDAFVAEGRARNGPVGAATSRLIAARELVAFAVPRMVAAAERLDAER